MGKGLLVGALFLFAGAAVGAENEHVRGDFRFRTEPAPAFVERARIAEQWPADAPGASDERWRYWLYDIQADRRGGRDAVYVEHVYEARGPSLVGEAGRFQVEFNPEYQQLAIHAVELRRDGTWHDRLAPDRISLARRESGFERDLADGNVTALLVLDDVRINDVVRIAYTVTGSNPVLEGQLTDWMRFGWGSPNLHSRLRVLLDPGRKPRVYPENDAPRPTIRTRNDGVEVSIEARATQAFVDEEHYPAWFQPYPLAQVGVDRSWREVVDWALPLYPSVGDLPEDLEARLADLRSLPDDRSRTTAVARLVQDDVRYFGVEMGDNTHRPRPPSETWSRRFGDCKDKVYLLVALLERLGIRAAPALVTTTRGKALSAFVPAASVFNHVIARVELDGEVLWIDPTISLQGGAAGEYDLSDYGAALTVFPGNGAIEPILPRGQAAESGVAIVERYTPGANARDVGLEVETVYRGDIADRQRRAFAKERSEDLSRRYSDFYSKRLGEIEVVAPPAIQDDRDGNVLRVVERYLLKAPFEDETGSVKALDVYADALRGTYALPASMSRTTPLAYTAPGVYRHEVVVELPERWSATFGKELKQLSSVAFEYERRTELGDGKAGLVQQLAVKQPEVSGVDATAHLGEVRKLQDSLSATLRFRMPASIAAEDRQNRLQQLLRSAIEEGNTE
jgi:hypothetical protein